MVVPILHIAFFIAALVNRKARLRRSGVRQTWRILADGRRLPTLAESEQRIWFHAASMGEFEQVKPIIEQIKLHAPTVQIVVSFFSPSGYEHQKNYELADVVVYLPLDSKQAAKRFLDYVQPSCAVFARYDLWQNMLFALKDRSVPTILVAATLNEQSPLLRFSAGRTYLRAVYNLLTSIYTAGESETVKFERLGITTPIITSADTRFDRIAAQVALAQKEGAQSLGLSESFFAEDDVVLVLGSSWKPDEDCIIEAAHRLETSLQQRLRLIVVPHEPTEAAIARLHKLLPNSKCFSDLQGNDTLLAPPQHVIMDSVGKLLRLYALADAAYIGGGFGQGVHSVAEPAGYGIPLASGANIGRARDAIALQSKGALTLIRTPDDAYKWLSTMLQSSETREKQGLIAHHYIHAGLGWSENIARVILNDDSIDGNKSTPSVV
jgi:3-deoxy-D-manno-octulosonic-acid transferase